jgi:hypothetical protein
MGSSASDMAVNDFAGYIADNPSMMAKILRIARLISASSSLCTAWRDGTRDDEAQLLSAVDDDDCDL